VSLADKESMERKVFLLPSELVVRLRNYQVQSGIASEVEAVRRLLDTALQMRDDVETILDKLEARFESEKDLRVLATEILTRHPLIKSVSFGEADCAFELKDEFWGRITWKGDLFVRYPDSSYDDWTSYKHIKKQRLLNAPRQAKQPSSEMDDEIPF
jgi:hypothetical protein